MRSLVLFRRKQNRWLLLLLMLLLMLLLLEMLLMLVLHHCLRDSVLPSRTMGTAQRRTILTRFRLTIRNVLV